MANRVVHVAVHDLKKPDGGDFEAILGKDELKVSETVERVVTELHGLYASKASKAHGKFSENIPDYPAQTFLDDFEKGGSKDFATLTHQLMNTLTTQAKRKPGATGGHVLFAHVEKDAHVFVLVAIVNDKLGATLTGDLDMADVRHLDLDGFRFAGRVNLTAWRAGAERYIGFLKGKGDVAEYFKEFLGCDTTVQDAADTRALVQALGNFADPSKGMVKDKAAFLQRAYDICQRHISEGKPLDFESFSNELFPDDPAKLAAALGDPELALGDGFVPTKAQLRSMTRFTAKTSLWTVEFDRRAISLGKVVYDAKRKSITINELPDDFVERLERDLEPNV